MALLLLASSAHAADGSMLVREDAQGQVWLAVNNIAWLAKRHPSAPPGPAVEAVATALAGLSAAAVAP
jgi:hypothetical protein